MMKPSNSAKLFQPFLDTVLKTFTIDKHRTLIVSKNNWISLETLFNVFSDYKN